MAGDRNNDFSDNAAGAVGPLVHPFFDREDGAECEPEQGDDPARVKNRGEQADVKDASRPADDAGSDRHQGETAAAHPNEKRERFPQRGRGQLKGGLVFARLDFARAAMHDPNKTAG